MRVNLKVISRPDVPGGLRTTEVIGDLQGDVVVGSTICVLGDPLEEGYSIRCINTSPVEIITQVGTDHVQAITETGSVYELTYL